MLSRLQNKRKATGMSQNDLSRKLEVSVMHISNMENGRCGASLRMALDVSKQIGYNIDPTGKVQTIFSDLMHLPVDHVIKILRHFPEVEFDTENLFVEVERS